MILNVRLRAGAEHFDFLQTGDSEWEALEEIVRITKYHGNDDRLGWDLYNIPHHCSYLALSDTKGERETIPKPLVKELLQAGKADSYIVSSSRPITDIDSSYDEIQPPHIQARKTYERYLREVKGRKFLVTMEEPRANAPEPLVFDITSGGVTWKKIGLTGAPAIITSRPPRAGVNGDVAILLSTTK